MFQLRTYTLRSADALHRYATVHWTRHVGTFATFGITTHGVWTEHHADARRLVALIGYPPDADVEALTRRVMASCEFAGDMAGFDVADILTVESVLLDPAPSSPVQ